MNYGMIVMLRLLIDLTRIRLSGVEFKWSIYENDRLFLQSAIIDFIISDFTWDLKM